MKNLEEKIYKYLKERNWDKSMPVDLAKSIMIEGAELLELFQWDNLSLEEVKNNKEKMVEIKKELADVLIYSIMLSTTLGINTEKVILNKLSQAKKKYPAKMMRDATRGGGDTVYWKIKKEHRKNHSK